MGPVLDCGRQSTNYQNNMNTVIDKKETKGMRYRKANWLAFIAGISGTVAGLYAPTAEAATVAWWRFEDAYAGPGTTLTTQDNAPTLNSILGNVSIPTTSVPGAFITDGVGGTSYSNGQSLGNTASYGLANAISGSGATALLNSTLTGANASWTWEAFVNIASSQPYGYGMLFGNGDVSANGIQMDLGGDDLSFRFLSGNAAPINTAPVFNFNTWTHIALTAQSVTATTWDITFYVNYSPVANALGVTLNSLSGDYSIFGNLNPLNASIDEMRISDTVLTTNQMLQAVPEPSTIGTAILGLVGLVVMRSVRRRTAATQS
ncbi:hypothetical protein BH09VER1_BH09VER1_07760 [soil metagenome]